jgi:nitrogen fixation protein NifQ
MSTYTDTIRRWAMDGRRAGALPDADGTGEVGLGADEAGRRLAVRFALRVRDGRAESVRFQVFGCGFTIAACAAAAELAEGSRLEDIPAVTATAVDSVLEGLPPERGYCADLAVAALKAAVASVRGDAQVVQAAVNLQEDHAPRVSADDPLYRVLMAGPAVDVPEADRHFFACLLCVAAREAYDMAAALGLAPEDVAAILETFFPGIEPALLARHATSAAGPPPKRNETVLGILLSHVPQDKDGRDLPASTWLARIIAARAAHPGHLWRAMGLFERPELSRAIRRHLPSLAAANHRKMRWKRFLFKQVCDLSGGVMCKAPDCGVCSDYSLCFDTAE